MSPIFLVENTTIIIPMITEPITAMKKEETRVKEDLFMCNGDYKKLNKQKRNSQFLK